MSQLIPDDVILGLLANEPVHGYQLLEHFRDPARLGRVWNLSTSQLYAVLKRLEQHGYIVGEEVPMADAPPRTEYALSEDGKERLQEWLYAVPSASIRRVRVEFLSRLYIARLLNIPSIPIVVSQREICEERRRELLAERDQAEVGVGLLAMEFVVAQLDAVLRWIERCELVPKDGTEP